MVYKYREVRGTFTALTPDTTDADEHPNLVPLNGSAVLTPVFANGGIGFTELGHFDQPQVKSAAIENGELKAVVVDEETGHLTRQALFLPVTVDDRADQTWSYEVSFPEVVRQDTGDPIVLPAKRFVVEDGEGPLNIVAALSSQKSGAIVTRGAPGPGLEEIVADSGQVVFVWDNGREVSLDMPEAIPGDSGPSAYEVAVAEGFGGSVDEWLDSLRGEQGERGPQGNDGRGVTILGERASEQELPETGAPGDAWLVAGDLWVWAADTDSWTNVGTIQGPQGEDGERGPEGPAGADGVGVPQTLSGSGGTITLSDGGGSYTIPDGSLETAGLMTPGFVQGLSAFAGIINGRTEDATPFTLVQRGAGGRASFSHVTLTDAPTVGNHAATKGYVDGLKTFVNVTDHGADTEAADNTAAFQAAVDALPEGGEVFVPPGTYAFDSAEGVVIPSGVIVRGRSATLTTIRNAPLLNVAAGADSVTIDGLSFRGNMPPDLIAVIQNQAGIAAYSDAADPITDLTVRDCDFVGVQGTAIRCRNVRGFRILNNDIKHHGYAAIGCHSVSEGIIEGNRVEGTRGLPAYSANSYGIYVSTLESGGPVGSPENPRSTDVLVRNNTVLRQAWSALDTHVGKRISFIGNLVHDCPAYAVNCVYIATSGADGALAPQDVLVENNTITYEDVMDDSSLLHTAVLFRGSIDFANPNRERATGIVRGNVIRRMGRQDDSNSGAIFVGSGLGVLVQGNTLHECRSAAVQVRDSVGTVVDSNTIVDLWRTSGQAAGVYLRISEAGLVMDVTITGNKFVRGRLTPGVDVPEGASINTNGITGSTSSQIVTVEANNEWGNAAMAGSQVRTRKGTGSQTIMSGIAPPTGSKPDGRPWIVGDQVENSSPAPDTPMGWVCASGGTPGVWRPFGQIGA